jgi:hypothetical protein
LNVYIIPYSTIDPNLLLKNGESYQQQAGWIIESVLEALDHDYRYRFSWPETYYFAQWYDQADNKFRDLAQRMVSQK